MTRIITLSSVSKRGKQLLKQYGNQWEIKKSKPNVLFSKKIGPWWYIVPITSKTKERKASTSRWMNKETDLHLKEKEI